MSGYHPAGAAGPARTFSGWGTCTEFEWSIDHVTAKASIEFKYISNGLEKKAIHTVEITWTTTNPTTSQPITENMNGVALDIDGMGRNADATIIIDKSSTANHQTWTTSEALVIHADTFSMTVP